MEETRRLLDSLMGQNRDDTLEEASKNAGKNFTQDNVCKFYLLGFCPQHELSNSKLVTKRNLGECKKVHSDAMKKEYENHTDREKYREQYEKQLLPFLESQVREADAWVARERTNVQKTANSTEKTTISTMPENVRNQVEALTRDMNKMMAAAEELAEKGDIEGSQFKVTLADEMKEKVEELEAEHPSYTVNLREEWVCDVCGTRTEAVTEANTTRFAAHFSGKVHLGYAKIREWVREIKKRQRVDDHHKMKDDGGRERGRRRNSEPRGRNGDDRRRRSPSRKDRRGDADNRRDRRRSRSGDRRDRDRRDRDDRRRSRSRDRDYRRRDR